MFRPDTPKKEVGRKSIEPNLERGEILKRRSEEIESRLKPFLGEVSVSIREVDENYE